MKKSILLLFLLCAGSIVKTTAATRYWVGGDKGNWSDTNSWSETSGGVAGAPIPTTEDEVFFDNALGNINPTVTLTEAVAPQSISFLKSNVSFAGKFSITTNTMQVNTSFATFVCDVYVNSSLSFEGSEEAPARIIHAAAANTIYRFQVGNGDTFTLNGHSAINYFEGGTYTNYRFNTTDHLNIYLKTTNNSLGAFAVDKGVVTLMNDLKVVRLNLGATNKQELILAPDVTFAIITGGSSALTSAENGGCVDVSALGAKFVVNTANAGVLDGTKRIFKTNSVINHFEFNSVGSSFNLFEPIRVRTLALTNGNINNSMHSITIVPGGEGVITGNGTVSQPVIFDPVTNLIQLEQKKATIAQKECKVIISFNAVKEGKAYIKLFSLNAQLVISKEFPVSEGMNNLFLETQSVSAGVYMLEFNDGRSNESHKIIIK